MLIPEKTLLASSTDRRKVMGTLGLAGLGMLGSSPAASAFTSTASPRSASRPAPGRKPAPAIGQALNFSDLPEEWVQRERTLLPEYTRYLTRLDLQVHLPQAGDRGARQIPGPHLEHPASQSLVDPHGLYAPRR